MNRVVVPTRQATYADGIDSLESILGLIKSLKIRDQRLLYCNSCLRRFAKTKGPFVTKQRQKVRG